jgi:hypothetical protein
MAYKLSGILRSKGNLPGKAFRVTFHLLDENGVPSETPDPLLTVTADDKGYWEQTIVDDSKRYEVREQVGEAANRITPLESREFQNLLVRNTLQLAQTKTPTSATATGSVGEICWDASYIYVAVGANTWKRAALNTW